MPMDLVGEGEGLDVLGVASPVSPLTIGGASSSEEEEAQRIETLKPLLLSD